MMPIRDDGRVKNPYVFRQVVFHDELIAKGTRIGISGWVINYSYCLFIF